LKHNLESQIVEYIEYILEIILQYINPNATTVVCAMCVISG